MPKSKGKVCATVEVEMEIVHDDQKHKEEDRARNSSSNEGRFFNSIPKQLFLCPQPTFLNPSNATTSTHPICP
jgi:hypothetical protein